jgi:CheY-like chemotaxis protein
MTGDATPEVAMSCDKAGFDGFLTKPFCIAEATKLLNHSTGISSSSSSSSRLTSAS